MRNVTTNAFGRSWSCFCELGESGLEQGHDGGMVHGLGAGKSSGASMSNDVRVGICCKESPDNLEVAILGCQCQRCG